MGEELGSKVGLGGEEEGEGEGERGVARMMHCMHIPDSLVARVPNMNQVIYLHTLMVFVRCCVSAGGTQCAHLYTSRDLGVLVFEEEIS